MLRYPVDYYNAAFNKWEYFLVLFIQVFISVCYFSLQLAAAPLAPPLGPLKSPGVVYSAWCMVYSVWCIVNCVWCMV